MRQWLHDHALSLAIASVWLALLMGSYASFADTSAAWWSERAGGHADDAFGALLIVVLAKWLRERNSPASK